MITNSLLPFGCQNERGKSDSDSCRFVLHIHVYPTHNAGLPADRAVKGKYHNNDVNPSIKYIAKGLSGPRRI